MQRGEMRDLASLLELEAIDRDLFRGRNADHGYARVTLYGGQVAAQALRAAALTVAGDRFPHSLHGYFLRPGRAERPVIFHVDRDRDGGSFSSRHVRAVQNGEVIFSMLASFHRDEESGTYERPPLREAPPPESAAPKRWDALLDLRAVAPERDAALGVHVSDLVWVRARHPIPDDRVIQACALTYLSDHGSGFGSLEIPGLAHGGPSIDHALWFHAPIRADDWVLIDLWPARARGARGFYQGSLRNRDGTLGALLSQEMLLRPRPPRAAAPRD
jgi:acyl-CoA thioesterase-2